MKSRATWLWVLIIPFAVLSAVFASGASAKPGPPGEHAEGHITADVARHPCLTAASQAPGARVYLAPCSSRLNADQVWKILRVHAVIIVGLKAHPGSCLGGVPEKVKVPHVGYVYFARTYDCGQQITAPEGLALGHIGGIYNTVINVKGWLLSAAHKMSGYNRNARWLPSSGNIPFSQVWLFPKFEPIRP